MSAMEPDLETGLTTTCRRARAAAADWLKPEISLPCIIAALCALGMVWVLVYRPMDTYLPTFSVEIASFDGIDGPKPPPSPTTLNPAFNLTLHGVSRRRLIGSLGLCQERGTVSVSYAGAVLAWGRVPKFCVPDQEQKQVRIVALGADVVLSDQLRDRMASERMRRTAELDVEIVLDHDRLLSCRVKLDEPPRSRTQSPCKVFTGDW